MRAPRLHGMPLGLAIALALVAKALILFWLWKTFFSAPPARHMRMPTEFVAQHLLDAPLPSTPAKDRHESHR